MDHVRSRRFRTIGIAICKQDHSPNIEEYHRAAHSKESAYRDTGQRRAEVRHFFRGTAGKFLSGGGDQLHKLRPRAGAARQQSALKMLTSISYTAPNGTTILGTVGPNPGVSVSGDFTNMSDYLSEFNSGGNVWANAMAIQDNAMAAASNNQSANQTKNIAQQGFNGDEHVLMGADPENGEYYVCDDGTVVGSDSADECIDGSRPQTIPNDGLCPPPVGSKGQEGTDPTTIQPGQVTSQESNTALKTGTENITSADDIAGLLDAFLNSLLNNLAQNAINLANSCHKRRDQHAKSRAIRESRGSALPLFQATAILRPLTQGVAQCLPSIQNAVISTSTGLAFVNLSAIGGAINTTCVANNTARLRIISDGTPIYNWTAPGSIEGQSATPAYRTKPHAHVLHAGQLHRDRHRFHG